MLDREQAEELPIRIELKAAMDISAVRERTLARGRGILAMLEGELTPEAVRDTDLSTFDTIVVDNRAYLRYPELARHNARLLEFVPAERELRLLRELQHAGTANVYAAEFSHDGRLLLTSSGDRTLRIWGE